MTRFDDAVRAFGIKDELARLAKRELRLTPEYDVARRDGRAREWLDSEASSAAEAMYAVLLARLEDLEP